jgi:hypothetical protein
MAFGKKPRNEEETGSVRQALGLWGRYSQYSLIAAVEWHLNHQGAKGQRPI